MENVDRRLPRSNAHRCVAIAVAALAFAAAPAAIGQGVPDARAERSGPADADLERCARIEDAGERLACYDTLTAARAAVAPDQFIERHWDLGGEARLFQPWPHRPNYGLPTRWSNGPNDAPFRDVAAATGSDPIDIQSVEAKFQISFKTKLLEGLLGGPGDLWFGYTQQSHFQIYNRSDSRPFRETDFEPEAIVTFPLRRKLGGWTWRLAGLGIVHQSNGRSEPLSRSWNRLYALAGIERGRMSIHVRPWYRFDSTASADDDNPRIEDFVGRLETIVLWHTRRHVFSFRGRSNLDAHGHRGSLQVDWFFPIGHRIRGQIQAFSGYGESLIDYNHRQNTVGIGFLLFDPF